VAEACINVDRGRFSVVEDVVVLELAPELVLVLDA
jgi:hypothetical protein